MSNAIPASRDSTALAVPPAQHDASNRGRRQRLTWLLALFGSMATAQVQSPPARSPAPVWNYEYDPLGNMTRAVQTASPTGPAFETMNGFDRLHRLRTITDARGGVTSLDYSGRADIASISDPRRLSTVYRRDGLGQVNQLISPDSGVTKHTYDAAGNLIARIDDRGINTNFSYDAMHRLTTVTHRLSGHPELAMVWRYDETGSGSSNGIGRLTSTSYPGGGNRLAYDPWGRVISATQTTDTGAGSSVVLSTQWRYNAAGTVEQLTYPSGRVLTILNVGGKPTALSLGGNGSATGTLLISDIQHEPFGPARSWNWHLDSGVFAHPRVFDSSGRMIRYPLGRLTRDVRYDAADRLVSYTHCCGMQAAPDSAIQLLNQTFEYDSLSRLTSAMGSGGSWTYEYDANGNRIATSTAGSPRNWVVSNTSNQLLAIGNPARNFQHDRTGNIVADTQLQSAWIAGYDLAGRLSTLSRSVIAGSGTQTVNLGFLYNGGGQRVAKLSAIATQCAAGQAGCVNVAPPSQAVIFVYGQQGELLGEYRASDGAMIREYVWLNQTPVAVVAPDASLPGASSDIFYIHADHLDTPRVVLDRAGRQRWTWLSGEPFGTDPPNERPQGLSAFNFNLRFSGQYFDNDSGLVYNHFRYYEPSLGRYTQSDPVGLVGGINTYGYVENNPLSYIDPEGLIKIYGNWCGPNWTGGRKHTYAPAEVGYYKPAVDATDAACRRHDVGYYMCRQAFPCDKQKRGQCMTQLDRGLGNEVRFNSGVASMAIYAWMNNNNFPDPGEDAPSCICTGK